MTAKNIINIIILVSLSPRSIQPHVQGVAAASKRSYSTFKVMRGDLVQSKVQQLRSAGAAVKRYPTSKTRETQVRR